MSLIQWVNFKSLGDSRGSLVAFEIGAQRAVPFDIKRVYYIYQTGDGVSRGFHAHRNLTQILICIAGSCRITLDNGKVRENVLMSSPTQGLIINSMVWREMHEFSSNCVLLVLASEHYDESDYIRDYESFIGAVNNA